MIEAGLQHSDPASVRVPDTGIQGTAIDDNASRRSREATLRAEINHLLARADSTQRVLQACTDAIAANLSVVFARIWTLERGHNILELQASSGLYTGLHGSHSRIPVGHLKVGLIAETRVPYLTNAVIGDPRIQNQEWAKQEGIVAFAGYPLLVDNRVIGVLAVFARQPLGPETLETLGSIAGIVAQGIERQRSQKELRRAIKENRTAVVSERRRIAREMHDGLLQNVTGIALQLRALLPSVRSAPDEAATVLERILDLAERTTTEARLAVVGMRHFAGSGDVVKAVQSAAERVLAGSALRLAVDVRGRAREVSPRICDATALIVEQAITNVIRHAQAETVYLTVDFGIRGLRVSIRDDGRGFVPDHAKSGATHFGLLGMRERAREIGAEVRVRSALARGTTVSVLVAYRAR
ncbi:MAG: GAF domain-containing protein [Gemmatimonadaceae bacterium]